MLVAVASWKEAATAPTSQQRKQVMNITLSVDGQVAIHMNVNTALLPKLLQSVGGVHVAQAVPKSTPVSKKQMEELLSRIDAKSVHFLKTLAASEGTITWGEMRAIFGIEKEDDWSSFSAGYGKGITRALRHILQDRSARLVWWNDEDWDESEEYDPCEVYIDGPALQALREAVGVATK
jgi:hypothetical protein